MAKTEHWETLSQTNKHLQETHEKEVKRFSTTIRDLKEQLQLSATYNAEKIEHRNIIAKQDLVKINVILETHEEQVTQFRTTIMDLEKQLQHSETNKAENIGKINMLGQNASEEIKHLQNQIENKSEEIQHLQDDLDYKNEELQIYQDEKEYPQTYPWTKNDKKTTGRKRHRDKSD